VATVGHEETVTESLISNDSQYKLGRFSGSQLRHSRVPAMQGVVDELVEVLGS